jgi:acid phosphatase (class A)
MLSSASNQLGNEMRIGILVIAGVLTLSTALGALAADAGHGDKAVEGPKGYLAKDSLPDGVGLIPPPPAEGSAALARDEEISQAEARTPESSRWQRAASDADLNFPHAAQTFACVTGVAPSPETTPKLYALLQRSRIDLGESTKKAKDKYQRQRPFMVHGDKTCTPNDDDRLRTNGSYPSGHTAIGWGWALLMAEIDPAHEDAILARGRAFGQSRVVCNVHWQSDVDAGQLVASATVARLHAEPEFQADMQAAKAELATARAAGRDAPQACDAEADSLK